MWEFVPSRETWRQVAKYTSRSWGACIIFGVIGYGIGYYIVDHHDEGDPSPTAEATTQKTLSSSDTS